MNLIRLEANLRFKSSQLRFLKDIARFLKAKTNFPDFTVCESKDSQSDRKKTQTAKTDQDFEDSQPKVVAKGFLSLDLRF